MFDLKGKKALITGASGGIGKEIAKTLDGYGAEICISGRNTEELDLLNDTIDQECKIITCDFSDTKFIKNPSDQYYTARQLVDLGIADDIL